MAEGKKTLVVDRDVYEVIQRRAHEMGLVFVSPRVALRYILGLEKLPRARKPKGKEQPEEPHVQ